MVEKDFRALGLQMEDVLNIQKIMEKDSAKMIFVVFVEIYMYCKNARKL